MPRTHLLLGSSLGDRVQTMTTAREALSELGELTAVSHLYETAPWGGEASELFLNQVVELHTDLDPLALLESCLSLEAQLGRQRTVKNADRAIDIDLLYYDQLAFENARLTLPHPGLHTRRFTLVPLAEIAPTLRHPLLGSSSQELLEACQDELEVYAYLGS